MATETEDSLARLCERQRMKIEELVRELSYKDQVIGELRLKLEGK
jgi:hypothetical protein